MEGSRERTEWLGMRSVERTVSRIIKYMQVWWRIENYVNRL